MAQYQWKLAQLQFLKIREKRQWKLAQFKWNLAQLQWILAQYILFNKWRRIIENWHTFTVNCKIHIVNGGHSPFFFKGVNNNDIDSSKRPDFAPLAQQYPGERHVRPYQFSGFETIYSYLIGTPTKTLFLLPPCPWQYFGRKIWSSGVSLKILQSAIQTHWP